MAAIKWVNLGKKRCHVIGEEVDLMEKRVYPTGFLDSNGSTYRVLMHRCSAGYQCNSEDSGSPCIGVEEMGYNGSFHHKAVSIP